VSGFSEKNDFPLGLREDEWEIEEFDPAEWDEKERRKARLGLRTKGAFSWFNVAPKHVATMPILWERNQAMLRFRNTGVTYREVGVHFGVSNAHAHCKRAEKQMHSPPIWKWMSMAQAAYEIEKSSNFNFLERKRTALARDTLAASYPAPVARGE
jgi:hypothetical protein